MNTIGKFAACAVIACISPLAAGQKWTWEAGKQTSNGQIIVKSLSGSTTYSATQNPTGAVAKTNQNAVTQPPTVIIQATGSAGVFNYKDDCWIFDFAFDSCPSCGQKRIGAGKMNLSTNKFTGVLATASPTTTGVGGAMVLSILTGGQPIAALAGFSYAFVTTYSWAGNSWSDAQSKTAADSGVLVGAANMSVGSPQTCYP